MNRRLKYFLLFVAFGAGTYGSAQLWKLAPKNALLNTASVIVMLVLGAVAIFMFIKMFAPKIKFVDIIDAVATGWW